MKYFTLLLLSSMLLLSCKSDSSSSDDDGIPTPDPNADITVVIDNVGSSSWEVTSVSGDNNTAATGQNNATLNLVVGQRYRFTNNGGSAHPLGFRNSNDQYLIAQGSTGGSFESDADVDFVSDANGITFTLTQSLADAMATYRCTIHASMEGSVTIR